MWNRLCYLSLSATFLIISSTSTWCQSFTYVENVISKVPQRSLTLLSKPSDFEDSDETPQVSDMEALLACRAYLKRKNRLGWPEGERRKQMRKEQPTGFGWGEGAEYSFGDDNNDAKDNDGFTPFIMYDEYDRLEKEYNSLGNDGDRIEEECWGVFAGMPTGPSKESALRSRHKKEQFQDPAWREKWHRARWGNHVKLTPPMKRERKNRSKFDKVPFSIWSTPEFESLTDEEIQIAITTYVAGNQKRSQKLRKVEQERIRKEAYEKSKKDEEKLNPESLFTVSEDILREKQRRRSEKAKKSYQTRMKRQREKEKQSASYQLYGGKSVWKPAGSSPQEAMIRINSDLNAECLPKRQDVEIMMEPTKLSLRRDTLRRILRDRFNLRGKCIPNDEGELTFVTQARIGCIGKFVLELLSREEPREPIN